MDALLRAWMGKGGNTMLEYLEEARKKVIQPALSIGETPALRAELRADAVRRAVDGAFDHYQLSVIEAFVDLLMIARAAMEDVRRATSEAKLRRVAIESVIRRLDGDSDLEFERALPLILNTRAITAQFTHEEHAVVKAFFALRPAYHLEGVFRTLESSPMSGERPDARPLAAIQAGPKAEAPTKNENHASQELQGGQTRYEATGSSSDRDVSLDALGRDLTALARRGELPTVVGREAEMRLAMETLCRRTKRNPVLVGPAGTGKTAIAEGIAQRMVAGDVPQELAGRRLVELPISAIMSVSIFVGEQEKNVGALIEEARAEGAILFIDEIHTMVGSGTSLRNDNDIAQMFKPAMARGDLLVIGATTESEYQHFIERDEALERRMNPIRIAEMDMPATIAVLTAVRDDLVRTRSIRIGDDRLPEIYALAREHMPNRHFPDKAIDLLEHCVAFAVVEGRDTVDRSDMLEVLRRRLGMPLELDEKLDRLRTRLHGRALLTADDADALVDRLAVTMRGLDVVPERANATILLAGNAMEQVEQLARTLAEDLYGSRDRLVRINGVVGFIELAEQHGARPSRAHGLQAVSRDPWTVILMEGLDGMDPRTADLLRSLLRTGSITDGRGRRIHISDTVVVATADLGDAGAVMGFSRNGADRSRAAAARVLGEGLAAEFDFVFSTVRAPVETAARWIGDEILPRLAQRYQDRGVTLEWSDDVVAWLTAQRHDRKSARDLERMVEEAVGGVVAGWVGNGHRGPLRLEVEGDRVQVEATAMASPSDQS